MTAPGDATSVGAIVGRLILDRSDWNRGIDEARAKAAELGRSSPDVRIKTNAAEVAAQLGLVQRASTGARATLASSGRQADDTSVSFHRLADSSLLFGTAAVPIGAVVGGALAGLAPTLASTALGISGIRAELKSGALVGTQYGAAIAQAQSQLTQLKTTAASGLLSGLNVAIAQSAPLFHEVNTDIGVMSTQLGNITAGAAPALLRILTQLNPLFIAFGTVISRGAGELERWASSSDAVGKFAAYAQTELPQVLQVVGNLAVLLGHAAAAAEGTGGAVLTGFGAVVRVLDALPIGVLQTLVPLLIGARAAMLGYGAVTSVVSAVNRALTSMGVISATSSQQQIASFLATRAAAANSAAGVAEAEATKARAFATTQAQVAESTAATNSILSEGAAATAETAAQNAASWEQQAIAARAAATQIGAAATTAAAESEAAGAAARVGWASMLGPAGAVVAGVGLLALTFLGTDKAAQAAAQTENDYTQALIASKGAIDDNVRALVAKNLADTGALQAAQQLGITLPTLTSAVTGNAGALAIVHDRLTDFSSAGEKSTSVILGGINALTGGANAYKGQAGAIADLHTLLGPMIVQFGKARSAANLQTAATQQQVNVLQSLNNQLRTTVANELAAAQSEDQFREAVNNVTSSIRQNGGSLSENTAKGLANRDAFLGAVQSALSYKDAQVKAGTSLRDATINLAANVQGLEDQAVSAGASRKTVEGLLGKLGLIPRQLRSTIEVDDRAALSAIRGLLGVASALTGGLVIPISAVATVAVGVAQARSRGHSAAGSASWTPTGKLPPGYSTVGERGWELVHTDQAGKSQVYSHQQSMRMTGMPDVLPGFAAGTSPAAGMDAAAVVNAVVAKAVGDGTPSTGQLTVSLGSQLASAIALQQSAVAAKASMDDEAAAVARVKNQIAALTPVSQKQANADRDHAAQLDKQARQLTTRARSMATSTASEKAAKKAVEDRAAALRAEAADDRANAATTTRASTERRQALETELRAAQAALAKTKTVYGSVSQAAKDAESTVAATAKQLVDTVKSETDDLSSQITSFKQSLNSSLTSGTSISDIWQQLAGTDANGNPIVPDANAIQNAFSQVLANTQSFTSELGQLASEGANQDFIQQVAGLGVTAGNQFAQALLAGGPGAVAALSSTIGQIQSSAASETDALATSFYGAGAKVIQQLIGGLESQYPALTSTLQSIANGLAAVSGVAAPVVAVAKTATITPKATTTKAPASTKSTAKAVSSSASSKTGWGTVPKFANGVTGFGGGVALVGERGPELVTLPRYSSVIANMQAPTIRVPSFSPIGAAGDTSRLEQRLAQIEQLLSVGNDQRAQAPAKHADALEPALRAQGREHAKVITRAQRNR